MAQNPQENKRRLQELIGSRVLIPESDSAPRQQDPAPANKRRRVKSTPRKLVSAPSPRFSVIGLPTESSDKEGEITLQPRTQEGDKKVAARNEEDDEDDSSSKGSPLFPSPPSPPEAARAPAAETEVEDQSAQAEEDNQVYFMPSDYKLSVAHDPTLPPSEKDRILIKVAETDEWEPEGYLDVNESYHWAENQVQVIGDNSPAETLWTVEPFKRFGDLEDIKALLFSTEEPLEGNHVFFQHVLDHYGHYPYPLLTDREQEELLDWANNLKAILLLRLSQDSFQRHITESVSFAALLAIEDVRSQLVDQDVQVEVNPLVAYRVIQTKAEAYLYLRSHLFETLNSDEIILRHRIHNRLSYAIEERRRGARIRIALGTLILKAFGEYCGIGSELGSYYRSCEIAYFQLTVPARTECEHLGTNVLVPYLKNKYPGYYFHCCARFSTWNHIQSICSSSSEL